MKRAIVGLVLLFFAQTAWGQSVKVKMDKTIDFSKYKTYTWAEGMPAKNPIVNQLIIDSIEQQLAARGLTKADANADIQVMFAAASGADLQIIGIDWSKVNYATGAIYRPPPPMDVRKGMLVIDMKDKKTERYIWRATAKETLPRAPSNDMAADAKRVENVVKKAVEKIFSKYPVHK